MKSQRVKPSPVTDDMDLDESMFLAGHGGNWAYRPVQACSETSGEPIRLRTGGRNGIDYDHSLVHVGEDGPRAPFVPEFPQTRKDGTEQAERVVGGLLVAVIVSLGFAIWVELAGFVARVVRRVL